MATPPFLFYAGGRITYAMANVIETVSIVGTGSGLPKQLVTNKDLAARGVDTTDAWIRERTGITQRYYVSEGESTSTLATAAARQALAAAGITAAQVGLVLVATSTPDKHFPGVASQVQQALEVGEAVAFDVQAACSGFVYGLAQARGLMAAQNIEYALLIGADTFSNILDFSERSTCVLFGDGAGAMVLRRTVKENNASHGLLDVQLGAAAQVDLLQTEGGIGSTGQKGLARMQGREVFKHAVRKMHDIVPPLLQKNGLSGADIHWLVPHQANARILQATAELLGMPMEKVVLTLDKHANTSAASIPLALDVAVRDGRIQPGQLVLLEAFGAGFTWGAALIKW